MNRVGYIFLTIAIFAIEFIIAMYVRDSFIRPHVGDVLVVVLIYCFIRCFIPKGVKHLPLYVFIFAAVVEFMQYFHIADKLEIHNRVIRIILGSTFDWYDLLAYAVGCLLIYIIRGIVSRLSK